MTDINIGGKYIGWSTNSSVRENGGSGGLVTAIFAAALHSGLVDKVIILKKGSYNVQTTKSMEEYV